MAQMNERTAELLAPEQAAEVVRILDLQAKWENMRGEPGQNHQNYSAVDLRGRQNAFEAFRSGLAAYTARYKTGAIPEVTRISADRVGEWCRTVRAALRRTEPLKGECPLHVVAKLHRMTERIAARLKVEPHEKTGALDSVGAVIRELDATILWCDQFTPEALARSGSALAS